MASTGAVVYIAPRFISGVFTQTTITSEGDFTNLAQWLPGSQHPLGMVDKQGNVKINPVWYRFFNYVANVKLGGASAPTVSEVANSVNASLTQSSAVAATVAEVAQQTTANAQALAVTVEVVRESNLPGYKQIPDVDV